MKRQSRMDGGLDYPGPRVYGSLSPYDPLDRVKLEDVRKAIRNAIDAISEVEHGLDCNRGHDDHECNCHFAEAVELLDDALDCLPVQS